MSLSAATGTGGDSRLRRSAYRAELQRSLGIPVVDPVQAAVMLACSSLDLGYQKGRTLTHDLVVRGTAVLPDGLTNDAWIAIDAGKITAIGTGAGPDGHRDV